MRQKTTSDFELEIRDHPKLIFRRATDPIYFEARLAAFDGNPSRALRLAEDAHIEKYKQMHGVTFRVTETTRSVYQNGPWEAFVEDKP